MPASPPDATDDATDATEATEPQRPKRLRRAQVLRRLTTLYPDARYLEIGVFQGVTFRRVPAARKVAVDPKFLFDAAAWAREMPHAEFHEVTSDDYFARVVAPEEQFDVIYLDGLHTFEQTLRDFTNALHHLRPRGVVLVDDTRPVSYAASLPSQSDARAIRAREGDARKQWMGDVYKLVYFVETFYPSLAYRTITDNHGQTVFWRSRREPQPRTVHDVDAVTYRDLALDDTSLRLAPMADVRRELRTDLGL